MQIVPSESMQAAAVELLDQSKHDPALAAQLAAINEQRWGASEDVRKLRAMAPYLPQLPEAKADEIYQRVCEQERRVAPHLLVHDYGPGTATYDDELAVFGAGPLILEAQHATNPVRKKPTGPGGADHGTAGIVGVMAVEGFGKAIIPLGRQTSNATGAATHPIRDETARLLANGTYAGFISFHGMMPGKVVDLRDPTEVHAIIGLGSDPPARVVEAAERLLQAAHDQWGLRVQIGNYVPHLNFAALSDWDGVSYRDLGSTLRMNDQGQPAVARMASTGKNHMVRFVRELTADQPNFNVAQLELARSIRKTPNDYWVRSDPTAEKIGVYLGYSFCALAASILG